MLPIMEGAPEKKKEPEMINKADLVVYLTRNQYDNLIFWLRLAALIIIMIAVYAAIK